MELTAVTATDVNNILTSHIVNKYFQSFFTAVNLILSSTLHATRYACKGFQTYVKVRLIPLQCIWLQANP